MKTSSARSFLYQPTPAQWAVIDGLHNPFIQACAEVSADQPRSVFVQEVKDDYQVRVYNIAPDGEYTFEELNGFHQGWGRYDSDGDQLPWD